MLLTRSELDAFPQQLDAVLAGGGSRERRQGQRLDSNAEAGGLANRGRLLL